MTWVFTDRGIRIRTSEIISPKAPALKYDKLENNTSTNKEFRVKVMYLKLV
mgnify:CR=1 FL=1